MRGCKDTCTQTHIHYTLFVLHETLSLHTDFYYIHTLTTYTYMHTCIHTNIPTLHLFTMHACIHAVHVYKTLPDCILGCINTYMHECTHIHIHRYIDTKKDTCSSTQIWRERVFLLLARPNFNFFQDSSFHSQSSNDEEVHFQLPVPVS